MNQQELKEKIKQQKLYATKICRLGLAFIISLSAVCLFSIKNIGFVSTFQPYFSLCWLTLLLIAAGVIIWMVFNHMRKTGLYCPECNKLLDKDLSEFALNTLKCRKFGKIIIIE